MASTVAFGLFALVAAPFILATPAHAADDNTVSITVDPSAELKSTGNLYKATTNVTVKTSKPYGFNLTMQADTADLVNNKDSTHKISATPSTTPVVLNANQWGYALDKSATTFNAAPVVKSGVNSAAPAVIADVTKAKPAGCTNPANCTKSVTFAANVDPAKLASGSYSTAIIYTATAKPKPVFTDWDQRTAKINPSDVCRSGDNSSSCLVDLDPNMIPVKYTGTTTNAQWTSISNPEDEDAKGNWYDYGKKQWANAVTVKKEALAKYQGQDRVVDQADILGFWVYIPRYAYEVMRRDGTDKPVKEQNFDIKFENIKTPKKRPLACKTGNGKDYRTECGVSRELPLMGGEASTWATHPAFTFGSKELNGIWFAKFETTGTTSQPTVLPGQSYINHNDIGTYYSVAKSLGVYDSQNVGGNSVSTTQDNHHLAKLSSHMVNNNDWGAATYLSASKYGAGYNGVHISPEIYNTSHNYNTNDGQLTSTTNNPTGIYDMFGGGNEYVAASYSDSYLGNSSTQNFGSAAHPPYVNTYNFDDPNSCTFATCGGQALYETNDGGSNSGTQWNGNYSQFVKSSLLWFYRGGGYINGLSAGLFSASSYPDRYTLCDYSGVYYDYTFRVALAPLQD